MCLCFHHQLGRNSYKFETYLWQAVPFVFDVAMQRVRHTQFCLSIVCGYLFHASCQMDRVLVLSLCVSLSLSLPPSEPQFLRALRVLRAHQRVLWLDGAAVRNVRSNVKCHKQSPKPYAPAQLSRRSPHAPYTPPLPLRITEVQKKPTNLHELPCKVQKLFRNFIFSLSVGVELQF